MPRPTIERDVFESDRCLSPLLRFLGHQRSGVAHKNDGITAWHHDAFEIFYFVEGRSRWWVDGERYDLVGNDVLFVPPDTVHSFHNSIRDVCEYYWLQLNASSFYQFAESLSPLGNVLAKELEAIDEHKLAGTPKLLELYKAIFAEHHHPDSLSGASLAALLVQLIAEVVRCGSHSLDLSRESRREMGFQELMESCRANPESTSVASMARVARMPPGQFRSVFVQQAGMTPHEFVVRAKIDKAKNLLATGKSVTETAHQLAFCSSQYFASVFRKFEGQTCSEFMRQKS